MNQSINREYLEMQNPQIKSILQDQKTPRTEFILSPPQLRSLNAPIHITKKINLNQRRLSCQDIKLTSQNQTLDYNKQLPLSSINVDQIKTERFLNEVNPIQRIQCLQDKLRENQDYQPKQSQQQTKKGKGGEYVTHKQISNFHNSSVSTDSQTQFLITPKSSFNYNNSKQSKLMIQSRPEHNFKNDYQFLDSNRYNQNNKNWVLLKQNNLQFQMSQSNNEEGIKEKSQNLQNIIASPYTQSNLQSSSGFIKHQQLRPQTAIGINSKNHNHNTLHLQNVERMRKLSIANQDYKQLKIRGIKKEKSNGLRQYRSNSLNNQEISQLQLQQQYAQSSDYGIQSQSMVQSDQSLTKMKLIHQNQMLTKNTNQNQQQQISDQSPKFQLNNGLHQQKLVNIQESEPITPKSLSYFIMPITVQALPKINQQPNISQFQILRQHPLQSVQKLVQFKDQENKTKKELQDLEHQLNINNQQHSIKSQCIQTTFDNKNLLNYDLNIFAYDPHSNEVVQQQSLQEKLKHNQQISQNKLRQNHKTVTNTNKFNNKSLVMQNSSRIHSFRQKEDSKLVKSQQNSENLKQEKVKTLLKHYKNSQNQQNSIHSNQLPQETKNNDQFGLIQGSTLQINKKQINKSQIFSQVYQDYQARNSQKPTLHIENSKEQQNSILPQTSNQTLSPKHEICQKFRINQDRAYVKFELQRYKEISPKNASQNDIPQQFIKQSQVQQQLYSNNYLMPNQNLSFQKRQSSLYQEDYQYINSQQNTDIFITTTNQIANENEVLIKSEVPKILALQRRFSQEVYDVELRVKERNANFHKRPQTSVCVKQNFKMDKNLSIEFQGLFENQQINPQIMKRRSSMQESDFQQIRSAKYFMNKSNLRPQSSNNLKNKQILKTKKNSISILNNVAFENEALVKYESNRVTSPYKNSIGNKQKGFIYGIHKRVQTAKQRPYSQMKRLSVISQ